VLMPDIRRDLTFAQQVLADAAQAQVEAPTEGESRHTLARMDRSAPW
jgi:hypothetical protein